MWPWLARLIPALEAGLVVALVLAPRWGGRLATAYLVGVTLVFALRLAQGEVIEHCGCTGTRLDGPVGWRFFLRNGVLLAAALVAGTGGAGGWPTLALLAATGAAAAVFVASAVTAGAEWPLADRRRWPTWRADRLTG